MHDILIQVYFIMEQKSVYLVAGQRTSNKIVIGLYPILRKSFQGLNCGNEAKSGNCKVICWRRERSQNQG